MKLAITSAVIALFASAQASTWTDLQNQYSWYAPIEKNANRGAYEIKLQTRDKGGAVKNLSLNVVDGEITNPEVFSQLSSTVGLLAQDVAAIAADLTKTVTMANNHDNALALLRIELDAVFADIYSKIQNLELDVADGGSYEAITYVIKNVSENKITYETRNFYPVVAKAIEGDGDFIVHTDKGDGKRELTLRKSDSASRLHFPFKNASDKLGWANIALFGDGEGIKHGTAETDNSIEIKGWNASPLPCGQDIANLMTNRSSHATSERLKHRVLARYENDGTTTMHYLNIGQLVSMAQQQQSGPWRFDEGQQRFKDTLIQVGASTVTLGDQQAPGIGTIYCAVTIADDGSFSGAELSTSATHQGKVVFAVGSLEGGAGGYRANWTRDSTPCIVVYQ